MWNKAIELQKRCLEQEVPFLKYTELAGRLVLWKKEDDMLWLLEAPSQALQQCLMDASAAIQAFKAKKKVHLGSPWNAALTFKEALQKPLFPSRIEQNCSVRFFFTTSKNGVFLPLK